MMAAAQELTYGSDDPQAVKDAKLRELILYVCKKLEDDPNFDEEKLKAVLFFTDFTAYRRFGKSITGQEYIKEGEAMGTLGLNAIDSAQERFIRRLLARMACLLFAHQSIGVITRDGDIKTRHEECLYCGKILQQGSEE